MSNEFFCGSCNQFKPVSEKCVVAYSKNLRCVSCVKKRKKALLNRMSKV
jgi:hypothetical protein